MPSEKSDAQMTARAMLPEEQLLVALAKPHTDQRDRTLAEAALSSAEFSWSVTLRLSRAQGAHAILAWNLKTYDQVYERLPNQVRAELATVLLLAKERRFQYHAALSPVFDGLQSSGIPFVLMKGAVVMETVYPPGTRWLNDLDLLVPARYRSQAIEIFVRYGFRILSDVVDPDTYHQLSLVTDTDGLFTVCVDLHWDVYPKTRPFYFDVEEVFARARPQSFGDHQVLGMSPEDTFVHYATQLLNDDFQTGFIRFCDMYGLWAASEPDRLVAIALATGAAGISHTALSMVILLGGSVPSDLLDGLARSCSGCNIASEFLADRRWLFGSRRMAVGAMNFLKPFYFPDRCRRQRYRWSFPLTFYVEQRRKGYSPPIASLRMMRALLLMLLCGGLLRLTASGSRPATKYLRDLLWKQVT